MPHLVLLGDSIFDNAQYTGGGPDVASQVRKLLPPGWGVSLLAVDGSTTANIPDQVQRLPREATHLVLSVKCGELESLQSLSEKSASRSVDERWWTVRTLPVLLSVVGRSAP